MTFALSPIWISSLFLYGWNAFRVLGLSIGFGISCEWLLMRLMRKRFDLKNGNVIWTGLLLGLLVPPDLSWSLILFGVFCAVVLAGGLFGGAGEGLFDPVQAGRAFLLVLFPYAMLAPENMVATFGWMNGLVGSSGVGFLAEAGLLPVLAGALIVIAAKRLDWRIPVCHLLSVFVCLLAAHYFCGSEDALVMFLVRRGQAYSLLGHVFFGAFFLMANPMTGPVAGRGRVLFAALCGILAVGMRPWFSYLEAMTFAVLLANAVVPLIDRYIRPASSFFAIRGRS